MAVEPSGLGFEFLPPLFLSIVEQQCVVCEIASAEYMSKLKFEAQYISLLGHHGAVQEVSTEPVGFPTPFFLKTLLPLFFVDHQLEFYEICSVKYVGKCNLGPQCIHLWGWRPCPFHKFSFLSPLLSTSWLFLRRLVLLNISIEAGLIHNTPHLFTTLVLLNWRWG